MATATPVSLRANFTWTFAGNAVYAASQWAILSLIAKSLLAWQIFANVLV